MDNNKWVELCYLLNENIKSDISENEFEQNVLRALEVLEWKEFLGNIQIRPSFQIGANNRIIPDFLIKSNDGKNLFVIEIKQPNIPLNSSFQQQLFSYMRQLKLEFGVLIGQSIQLFYDGQMNNQDTPILLETIKFERENQKGREFINLFNKSNFNESNLENFTIKAIQRIDKKKDFKRLTEKITSKEFSPVLSRLIKQHFINDYDSELLDSVLKNIQFYITDNNLIETPQKFIHSNKIKINNSKPGVINSIIDIISSPHTQDEILQKLTLKFPERNPDGMKKTISCQLGGKSLPLRIEQEQNISVKISLSSSGDNMYVLNNSNGFKTLDKFQNMNIGQFVQIKFRELYKNNLLTPDIINNLQKSEFSKRTLNQNFEVLRNTNRSIKDENGRNRYYAKELFCGGYYLTSQWYDYHREPFINWLKSFN